MNQRLFLSDNKINNDDDDLLKMIRVITATMKYPVENEVQNMNLRQRKQRRRKKKMVEKMQKYNSASSRNQENCVQVTLVIFEDSSHSHISSNVNENFKTKYNKRGHMTNTDRLYSHLFLCQSIKLTSKSKTNLILYSLMPTLLKAHNK